MKPIDTKFSFQAFAESRIGGRPENQDTCAYQDTPIGLLVVVCDGMGGGPSGKTASSVAADAIVGTFMDAQPDSFPQDVMVRAVKNASEALREAVRKNPSYSGMGTTMTALLINDKSAVIAHIGDSRVYQLRGKRKIFRTFDHSQVFELMRNGAIRNEEEARVSPASNVITRALGPMADPEADIVEVPYEKGDRFMLCTDGIWGAMPEKELLDIVGGTQSLSGAVESIAIKVDEIGRISGGGHDNLTVAMIQTLKNSKLKQKMSTKVKYILYILAAVCAVSLICNIVQFRRAKYVKSVILDNVEAMKVDTTTPPDTLIQMIEDLRKGNAAIQRQMEENERRTQEMESKYNQNIKDILEKISSGESQTTEEVANQVKQESATMDMVQLINSMINQLDELKKTPTGDLTSMSNKLMEDYRNLCAQVESQKIQNTDFKICEQKDWFKNYKNLTQTNNRNYKSHVDKIKNALESLKRTIQTTK